jgi:hypothetical protein
MGDSLLVWVTDDGTVVPAGDPEAMYPKEVDLDTAAELGFVEAGQEHKQAPKVADKQGSASPKKAPKPAEKRKPAKKPAKKRSAAKNKQRAAAKNKKG